jgi:thioredoxin reductase (NADPH)
MNTQTSGAPKKTHKLIIIGSGPAGLTAGVYTARAQLAPIIIDGTKPGGQLMGTTFVENWPGEKSILGPKLMMNMRDHAKSLGCEFISETIVKADLSKRPFTLTTNRDKVLKAESLIIATGSTPNRLNCPGEDTYWGKGVTSCAVCDGAFYNNQPVVVIGGGDSAMEAASFMTKFTKQITLVHILDHLTASKAMQARVLDNPNIKIIYNSTVTEYHGDSKHVTGVTVTNQKTGETQQLKSDGVFINIGYSPNTQIFENQLTMDKFGYLSVTNHTHTSVQGVFAGGDVSDYRYRQAVTSAGAGCMAALDAENFLAEFAK